ncbi:MAG: AmmeMemoRadiSam system radical SAM enzyme [Peptococcaceae bacterium]
MSREAMYWTSLANDAVRCFLCPHHCVIPSGNLGICRVRKNENGSLQSLNYGLCTAIALDPIEKKPLYHYYPGSNILSIGTFGCNLQCSFCQNWEIAHGENPPLYKVTAREMAELARRQKPENNIGIAYTYSEPLMWYEFLLDTAEEIKNLGLSNILVSNGYIEEEPLRTLLPYIDAANIDVKAFNQTFYPRLCKGQLDPVKRTVEILAEKCHLEITTLVIPGANDAMEEVNELAEWVAGISKDIPLHLTRYFPNYKLHIPATPIATLKNAGEIARRSLSRVYLGNI